MAFEDMKKVVPLWFNLSIAVHNDEEAVKEWGWVQEMYAFTLACFKAGIKNIDLHLKMMSQPPWDEKLEPYYILHYTYGMDYTKEGKFTPGKILKYFFWLVSFLGLSSCWVLLQIVHRVLWLDFGNSFFYKGSFPCSLLFKSNILNIFLSDFLPSNLHK